MAWGHRLNPRGPARESVIATASGGYALVAERVRVDVARFDELVTAATGRTASRALPPLTAAAHLADRPLLADERSAWAFEARRRYRARLLETLLDGAGHALIAGQSREALGLAARAVRLDPVAERGWVVAMTAHRALGERAAALRAEVSSLEGERDAAVTARDKAYAEIDASAAEDVAARASVVGELPGDLLALYERVRAASGGVGAAELRHRRCEGCRLELAGSELRAARAAPPDEVLRCENCRRILVRTPDSGL